MTTEEMNDLMREVNAANARGDRQAAIEANEKLAKKRPMTEQTPEAFPVPADVLAEAEEWAREFSADYPAGHMDVLLAEYERRGRIVEAATALVWLDTNAGDQLVIEGDGGAFNAQLDALVKEVRGDE